MYLASEGGHYKAVRILMDVGADVKALDGFYGITLQAAAVEGHGKVVRILIGAGAVDGEGSTDNRDSIPFG